MKNYTKNSKMRIVALALSLMCLCAFLCACDSDDGNVSEDAVISNVEENKDYSEKPDPTTAPTNDMGDSMLNDNTNGEVKDNDGDISDGKNGDDSNDDMDNNARSNNSGMYNNSNGMF